ncbi:uncharacterized protein C8A04DRAFT_34091 [Dichotomopilus funicola]|uniref:C2H2-type domain-containing protein n=1 Tax=Dichotomopilus funicola TaxID=1934379 RepID=A0AAN6VAH7_9PEZI|nr:hypothetical protein C8A04DRAFT_34091 [Dichotomopilus funicola]
MYPCPFRKRNPVRFNVREHEACAKAPFESIGAMIRHVLTHHQLRVNPHQCRRCKEVFETGPELERHVLAPRDEICEVTADGEHDLEDGLTEDMIKVLASMSLGLGEEMWTWENTWALIFPDDVEVPAPDFDPVTELVEVEQAFDEEQDALKKSLRDKLHLLLPKDLGTDYLNFLAGQLELVFETHRVNVMKRSISRCRSPASGHSPSGTPRTEHQTSLKKENRKSRRRSTMLQNILQRGAQGETSPGLGSPRNPKSIKTGRKSTQFSPASFLLRIPRTPKNTLPEATQDESPPSPMKTPDTDEYGTDSEPNVSSPRDSRDSGIGMPCDTCESEGDSCTTNRELVINRLQDCRECQR